MARSPASRILSSMPVRQALLLVAVVAAVNFLTLGGAYLKLRADLAETLQANLDRETATLDRTNSWVVLMGMVWAKATVTDPTDSVIVYLSDTGRQVGNAMAVRDGEDLVLKPMSGETLSNAGYLKDARRLPGGVLIVAESLAPMEALRETFVTLLILSLVPTVILSLGIGVLIARQGARRVASIEHTLERLTAGDLAARVTEAGGGDDDLARIGEGVNRMASKQEGATAALRQVSSDIAHDMRTPLQRISVLLHDLDGRLPEGGEAAGLAAKAREEADHAVAVFRAMLQIAQIEGGNLASTFEPLDLRDAAERVAELYQPAFEERGGALDVDLPPEPVAVMGEGHLIAQALSNLVENALRHTPEGTRLRISVARRGPVPVLTVADDGPGIPAEERENVIRRHYRLERSRTTPGSGLGLALVSAIAGVHGAELVLEDNAPGLRVSLVFPA